MNKEQAISVLKVHKEFWGEEIEEALNISIKELEDSQWHIVEEELPELDRLIIYAFKPRDLQDIGYNSSTVTDGLLNTMKNQGNIFAEYIAWRYIDEYREKGNI